MGTNVCESVCKNVSMARIGWRSQGQHRPKPESTCSSRIRLPVGCLGVQGWAPGLLANQPGLHGSPLVSEKKRHNGTSPKARNTELSRDQGKEKLCLQVKKALEATWTPFNCSYLDATHLQEAMFKPSLRTFLHPTSESWLRQHCLPLTVYGKFGCPSHFW